MVIDSSPGEFETGFSELFDEDGFNIPGSSADTAKVVSGLDGVFLKREYENLGFVAMISDTHSRRIKHIQALALNIPCLHFRWIHDSLAASRPLPFAKYLLPAGESTFLEPAGVVRSRNMAVYDPASENVRFTHMLRERALLMANQSVLVVTGRTKKEVERKQAYIFLLRALGPGHVTTCKDVAAAKSMVDSGEWDWVYADGGAPGVADAVVTLFGDGAGGVKGSGSTSSRKKGAAGAGTGNNNSGSKRKRDDELDGTLPTLVTSGVKKRKKVRVVSDEFVIQSLILGALVEE